METFEENSEEDINKKENHTADDQEADKANEEKEEIEKAGQNGDGEVQENKDTTQNDNMEEGELQTETVEVREYQLFILFVESSHIEGRGASLASVRDISPPFCFYLCDFISQTKIFSTNTYWPLPNAYLATALLF